MYYDHTNFCLHDPQSYITCMCIDQEKKTLIDLFDLVHKED